MRPETYISLPFSGMPNQLMYLLCVVRIADDSQTSQCFITSLPMKQFQFPFLEKDKFLPFASVHIQPMLIWINQRNENDTFITVLEAYFHAKF